MELIFDEADGNIGSTTIPAGLSPHPGLRCRQDGPSQRHEQPPDQYQQLAQAPAPALIGEGLRASYEMVAGSPEVVSGRGDVAYSKGDYGAGLVQIDVVAL